jgi:hypothetical protein
MDRGTLDKLRRNQALRQLPDGREGVDVTVQFVGQVPPSSRAERKTWLQERFSRAREQLGPSLAIKPESLSVSAQTVEAVVPVSELDDVRKRLSPDEFKVDVSMTRQIVDGS